MERCRIPSDTATLDKRAGPSPEKAGTGIVPHSPQTQSGKETEHPPGPEEPLLLASIRTHRVDR